MQSTYWTTYLRERSSWLSMWKLRPKKEKMKNNLVYHAFKRKVVKKGSLGTLTQVPPLYRTLSQTPKYSRPRRRLERKRCNFLNAEIEWQINSQCKPSLTAGRYLRERLDCLRFQYTKAMTTSNKTTPSRRQMMATVKPEDWVLPLCSDVRAKASGKKRKVKYQEISLNLGSVSLFV